MALYLYRIFSGVSYCKIYIMSHHYKNFGPICNLFYMSDIDDYLSGSYCKTIIGCDREWYENQNSSRSTGMYILFLLIYLRGSERKCHSKTWKFFELLCQLS